MHLPVLALDIGHKRIGLAVGSLVPFGRGVIEVTTEQAVVAQLQELIEKEGIQKIVIGLPYVTSETETDSFRLAKEWGHRLETHFGLPVAYVNEAYSSLAAEQELRAKGVDTQKDKWRIDERAAELLLAQYLNESKEA